MEQNDSPPVSIDPIAHDLTVAPATSCALAKADEHQKILDAYGHDPADYKWVPVLKKRRADGWSPEKQRAFIASLADTGSVRTSAYDVSMTPQSAYALRRSVGAEGFAAAWDAAIGAASKALIDVALDRALNGVEDPVFDKDGRRVACRTRYNDRLLMFLLRAHSPERYRHANRDGRDVVEALPPAQTPIAEALRLIDPVPPAEPHKLMAPEELDVALECAEILPGRLPHWHRDPDLLHEENLKASQKAPLGEAFEEALEVAKRAANPAYWRERQDYHGHEEE